MSSESRPQIHQTKTQAQAKPDPEAGPAEPSIYDAIGGAPAVAACVSILYGKLLDDPELGPMFARVDPEVHNAHLRAFLTAALGGPSAYTGRTIAAAHAHAGISDHHFDLTAGFLVHTLRELDVSPELIDEIVAIVLPLRAQVVTRPRQVAAS